MENKNLIATALRMIGKNIMLIADAIYKEDEPAAVEEKPKKRTRKTAKAEPKTESVEEKPAPEAEPVPEEKKPEITFQQVRAVLAQKSREGYTSAVKNIIEYFGAEKLSDIKPENYAEVLEQAEMIGIDG